MKARNLKNFRILTQDEFNAAMAAKKSAGRAECAPRVYETKEYISRKIICELFHITYGDLNLIEALYDTVDYDQIYKDLDNYTLREITPVYGDRIISTLKSDKVWGIKNGNELKISYMPKHTCKIKVVKSWGALIGFPVMDEVHFSYPEDEGTEAWVDKYYYESY